VFLLNSSFTEVFKIPKLISHFSYHNQLDSKIGIIDFICMHYLGQDIDDDDSEQDMELPFKKINSSTSIQTGIPVYSSGLMKVRFFFLDPGKITTQITGHSNPAPGCLFRPPRT